MKILHTLVGMGSMHLWLLCHTQIRWPELPARDKEVLKKKKRERKKNRGRGGGLITQYLWRQKHIIQLYKQTNKNSLKLRSDHANIRPEANNNFEHNWIKLEFRLKTSAWVQTWMTIPRSPAKKMHNTLFNICLVPAQLCQKLNHFWGKTNAHTHTNYIK